MKRFFCTICQRVKRVRNLPSNVVSVNSMTPTKREGTCDKHFNTPVTIIKKSDGRTAFGQAVAVNLKKKGA
jgi:hypothetical protein